MFGLEHRTNNLVESFNGELRKSIPASGNFYKFVDSLRKANTRKHHDLELVYNGVDVYARKGKKLVAWSTKINESQDKLLRGQFSEEAFLDIMTYRFNGTADLASFDRGNIPSDAEPIDDDEDNDNVTDLQAELQLALEMNRRFKDSVTCIICTVARRECLLQKCNHMALCAACCARLRQTEPFSCPVCRSEVTNVIQVIFS